MTAQLLAFPIAGTLGRHALQRAATAMRLDISPAISDDELRDAVRAKLHHLANTSTGHTAASDSTFDSALEPGDFARLTSGDHTILRTAAARCCAEPDCRANTDQVAQDALSVFAHALRDATRAWRPKRADLFGAVTTWTAHAGDGQVTRLIGRGELHAAAITRAARHNGCTHQASSAAPAAP